MATYAKYQSFAQDSQGNVIVGPNVEVRRESDNALVSLFSDRAGATPRGNPFVGGGDGLIDFHVAGGAYKITITKGSFSRTLRYVAIGTYAELDIGNSLNINDGGTISFGTAGGNATVSHASGSLSIDGPQNGFNFLVGTPTSASGVFKQITILGSDTGSGAGSFIQSDHGAGTTLAWVLGNRSAITGGAYDRTTVLMGRDSIQFALGLSLTTRYEIMSSGHGIWTPPNTTPESLTVNGTFTLTPTSNTNFRISYRGSDGTTRVGNITLA